MYNRNLTCRALLSSFSFLHVNRFHCRLLDWTHVADGDCWKDELLRLLQVDADTFRVAEVGRSQSEDAVRQTTHQHHHRRCPVARLHNAFVTHTHTRTHTHVK